jgi:lantibiotic modifying enzyme
VAGLSSKNAKGTFWKSKLKGDDSVYLGISHGTAALIMFFQKAVMSGIDFNWRDLIASASGYVVNNEWKGQPTFYPVIVGEQDGYSIFANNWCYGDPGTLYGLLQASLWLNDDELKKYTLEKFSHVVKRHNDNVYLVAGYGLLYGNAGLAMLYRKCHKLTKESFFNDAYHEHLDLLLANYNSCADFLGYRGYWNQDMEVTNYSFSEGMIGIALTLMADRDASFADYYHPFFYM